MTTTITLAGREYPIAPLKLGKLRRAAKALATAETHPEEIVDVQCTLIFLAVSQADPAFKMEMLDDLAPTFFEVRDAASKIVAMIAGTTAGEARPAAAPAT